MRTLLIFHAATGTRSSRKIRQRCEQDVACRVIVGEDAPDFHAISEFRLRHLDAFEKLFVEVLELVSRSGWVQSPIGGHFFRPKGPGIHPARANGPGTEVTIFGQAQRADSSSPLL